MKVKAIIDSGESTPTKAYSPENTGETTMKSHCINVLDAEKEKSSPIRIPLDEYEHLDKLHKCLCDEAVKEGSFIIVEPGRVENYD